MQQGAAFRPLCDSEAEKGENLGHIRPFFLNDIFLKKKRSCEEIAFNMVFPTLRKNIFSVGPILKNSINL